MLKTSISFFTLLFINLFSIAQTKKLNHCYYVSPSGDDSNDGSIIHPFRTIQRINQLDVIDCLFFQGGSVFSGTVQLKVKGEKKHLVLLGSYGKGKATLNGGNKESVIITGSFFRITNLICKGSGRKEGNTTNGILLINAQNAFLDQLRVEGFQKSGVEVFKAKNIYLKFIVAENNGLIGISIDSSNFCSVDHCKAMNNPGDPTLFTNHSGNGILIGYSDHVTINRCVAAGNGWDMPHVGNGPVGIWAYESDHILIQYCISYHNRTSKGSSDGGGFDLDGGVKNSIIQYCLSYENEGSGYGLFQYSGASNWYNNEVRFCISINDGQVTKDAAGILIWNGSNDSNQFKNCSIYNNVIYNNKVPAVQFLTDSKTNNFFFYNNIFIGTDTIVKDPSSSEKFICNLWNGIEQRDLFFRQYKSLKQWTKMEQQEINGIQKDPLFANPLNYHITDADKIKSLVSFQLGPHSPARRKAIKFHKNNLPAPIKDYYGLSIRTEAINMGIDQSN